MAYNNSNIDNIVTDYWLCEICQSMNYQSCLYCTQCTSPRPIDVTDFWLCEICESMNYQSCLNCTRCTSARPIDNSPALTNDLNTNPVLKLKLKANNNINDTHKMAANKTEKMMTSEL